MGEIVIAQLPVVVIEREGGVLLTVTRGATVNGSANPAVCIYEAI